VLHDKALGREVLAGPGAQLGDDGGGVREHRGAPIRGHARQVVAAVAPSQRPVQERARPGLAAAHDPQRLRVQDRAEHRERGPALGVERRLDEDERANEIGPREREVEGDDAADAPPDDHRGVRTERVEQRGRVPAVAHEVGHRGAWVEALTCGATTASSGRARKAACTTRRGASSTRALPRGSARSPAAVRGPGTPSPLPVAAR
jgi:hypothetical protein